MGVSSKVRAEKIKLLKATHNLEPGDKFIPKMAYGPAGKKVMGFYEWELKGGLDIYTETIDINWDPEQIRDKSLTQGKLYKWIFNPQWDLDYIADGEKILIPVSELVEVVESVPISSFHQLSLTDFYGMISNMIHEYNQYNLI